MVTVLSLWQINFTTMFRLLQFVLLCPSVRALMIPSPAPTVGSIEILNPHSGVYPYNVQMKISWITQGSALSTCGDVDISLYSDSSGDGREYFASIAKNYPNEKSTTHSWTPSETTDSNGDPYGEAILGNNYEVRVQCSGSVIDSDFSESFDISLTPNPTLAPTLLPSSTPTSKPSMLPSPIPTSIPSPFPSRTKFPTLVPTLSSSPTMLPNPMPTSLPTPDPTILPTTIPTPQPTLVPRPIPTPFPTSEPSLIPVPSPTFPPSLKPTPFPSFLPTPKPTHSPTQWIVATDHGWLVAGWVGGAMLIVLAIVGIYFARRALIQSEKETQGVGTSYLGDEYTQFDEDEEQKQQTETQSEGSGAVGILDRSESSNNSTNQNTNDETSKMLFSDSNLDINNNQKSQKSQKSQKFQNETRNKTGGNESLLSSNDLFDNFHDNDI